MGCHRSGTNLLYDTLLSAGGFAVYRDYLPVYEVLIPRFGSLKNSENRRRMLSSWLRSKAFRRSGVDAARLTEQVLRDCSTGGDFVRIVMEAIARQQNVARWAAYDAENVLYVKSIKREIPEALFIHIIRDGRDIALSLRKMRGFKPFPWWGASKSLRATALYWEWMVRQGQGHGRSIPADYLEVHYEELLLEPRRTLATLGRFLDQDLDYDRIQSTRLGRLRESNSSFREEKSQQSPVNRWKDKLSPEEIVSLETLVGEYLEELGYPLTTPKHKRKVGVRENWMRTVYHGFFDAKVWLKLNTPLGKLASLSQLELADPVRGSSQAESEISATQHGEGGCEDRQKIGSTGLPDPESKVSE